MRPRPPKTLQREWDKKLAESGFVDIEKNGQLKVWENLKWTSPSANVYCDRIAQEKLHYSLLAEHFLNEWAELFMTEIEIKIWSLHTNALGCRAIVAELAKDGFHTNKDYVSWVVADLKEIMFRVMDA